MVEGAVWETWVVSVEVETASDDGVEGAKEGVLAEGDVGVGDTVIGAEVGTAKKVRQMRIAYGRLGFENTIDATRRYYPIWSTLSG